MAMTVQYLRDVGSDEDECWVPCSKTDPGAVRFVREDELPRHLTRRSPKTAVRSPGNRRTVSTAEI